MKIPRFDSEHSQHPHSNDPLGSALHDVVIPEGLESRLLASVSLSKSSSCAAHPNGMLGAASDLDGRSKRWSRRHWLAAGVAAGCASVLAGGGYVWPRRKLTLREAVGAVLSSLAMKDWMVPWEALPGEAGKFPIPKSLRAPRGWQFRETLISSHAVAYDLSVPGCSAVLFVIKTRRDISSFPTAPPERALPQSGAWNYLAVWRGSDSGDLYVLAFQGPERNYERLFTRGRTAPLA